MQGTVKMFDPSTNEGLVVRDTDREEFVLAADALEGSIFRMLRQGQRVVFESRASASNVPITTPPAVAIKVNMMVKRIPSKKRYGSERMITSQSILENMVSL